MSSNISLLAMQGVRKNAKIEAERKRNLILNFQLFNRVKDQMKVARVKKRVNNRSPMAKRGQFRKLSHRKVDEL